MPALGEAWNQWVVANLLRDQPIDELVQVLIEEGMSVETAQTTVRSLAASPGVRGAHAAYRTIRRTHLMRRTQLRIAGREVPHLAVGSPLFSTVFVAGQQPVVLNDATHHWPALRWTWRDLATHDVQVQASVRRTRSAFPDHQKDRQTQRLCLSKIIEQVLDPSVGNDLYVTARDGAIEVLQVLRPDILPIPGIVDPIRGGIDIWIGGAGACTPLHYDTSSAILCPVLGRKRVWLVPPEEDLEEEHEHPFWAVPIDLNDPERAIREVDVHPGDALLIPAGWWHAVRNLDPSFSVTLADLCCTPNQNAWYGPPVIRTAPPHDPERSE